MKRIVTSTYRYKRPPRKRKTVALDVPAVVAIPDKKRRKVSTRISTSDAAKATAIEAPGIVTARRKGRADVPDLTPEELQRRADAADRSRR